MEGTSKHALEDLLGHADWLDRLAHRLVRNRDLASDAVQDTWLAAVRNPPPADRPARPWLARVLRNAVRMRARTDERRERRERVAAPADPATAGAPDELVARVQTQVMLARRVLALDEPYRTTILLRYHEGLSAAAIARRLDVPPGTIRWRLKQGIERMREALDRAAGGRAAWQLAVAPLIRTQATTATGASAVSGAAAVKGALAMSTFKTAAAAIAAVGIATTAVWVATRDSPADERPETAAQVVAAEARASVEAPNAARTPELQPATGEPAAAPATTPRRIERETRDRLLRDIARARQRRLDAARAARAAPPTSTAAAVGGGPPPQLEDDRVLDKDYLRDQMGEIRPLFIECYNQALERNPSLEGNVTIEFTIVGEPEIGGLVATSELDLEASTLTEPEFAECVQESVYALELVAPEGGGTVTVRYPFLFTSQ